MTCFLQDTSLFKLDNFESKNVIFILNTNIIRCVVGIESTLSMTAVD